MNIPGFIAHASLYRTTGRYRTSASDFSIVSSREPIVPAAGEWAWEIGPDVAWSGAFKASLLEWIGADFALPTCDAVGKPCCGPDAEVKTPHCHRGLGCNIATGECEACGGPGQVCCDGHYTGFSLRGYTNIFLDPMERIESCDTGARCDAQLAADGVSWTGTRRCQPCGTKLGGACCAPDNYYGLGRCFRDAATDAPLVCNNPWAGAGGSCVACGKMPGQPVCHTAGELPCADDGLVEENGICVPCGYPGMPPCYSGCHEMFFSVLDWRSNRCIEAGGSGQPCLRDGTCRYPDLFCNSKRICEPCGNPGQTCCPPSTGRGQCQIGECRNGSCFACGYENMPVCSIGPLCRAGSEPVNGLCRHCGLEGEVCCSSDSIRCDPGMRCKDNVCKRPALPPPPPPPDQWKTCSGQPYTWTTKTLPIWIEDDNGCIDYDEFVANSPEEAIQCARDEHGEAAVISTPLEEHTFAVTCNYSGCVTRQYSARNHAQAQSCAEYEAGNECSVADGACPP